MDIGRIDAIERHRSSNDAHGLTGPIEAGRKSGQVRGAQVASVEHWNIVVADRSGSVTWCEASDRAEVVVQPGDVFNGDRQVYRRFTVWLSKSGPIGPRSGDEVKVKG
jgi:hypothetical protein